MLLTLRPSLVASPSYHTRTPLTTIPIHSRDQRKPPFCYTVVYRRRWLWCRPPSTLQPLHRTHAAPRGRLR